MERETLTREDLDEIFNAHELTRSLLPPSEELPLMPSRFQEELEEED